MRKEIVNALAALAVLALVVSLAQGQVAPETTKPKPTKEAPREKTDLPDLSVLLAEALNNHPDIRVAEAKVQEAGAELQRARLLVIQKVTALRQALEGQLYRVKAAEARLKRIMGLVDKGAATENMKAEVLQDLISAKAHLDSLKAELPYFLGQTPPEISRVRDYESLYQSQLSVAARRRIAKVTALGLASSRLLPLKPSRAEQLRKILNTPIKVDFSNTPLKDVLDFLQSKIEGVSFRLIGNEGGNPGDEAVELKLKQEVPLGAVLQGIQDGIPNLRFVIRDYGILVTWKDQLPPNALLVEDFYKSEQAKPDKPANPTDSRKEGTIRKY